MPVTRIAIPPGISRESTRLVSGPRWFDSNNIRFRDQEPETIGGWVDSTQIELDGIGRSIHSWKDFDGGVFQSVATTSKLYIINGTDVSDITPETDVVLENPFTSNSTSLLSINHASHGRNIGDYVRIKAVEEDPFGSVAESVFTSVVSGYQVVSIEDTDNYTIDVLTNVTTATGGLTVTLGYKVKTGNISSATGNGFGAGKFGGDDLIPTEYTLINNPVQVFGGAIIQINVTGSGAIFDTDDWIYPMGLSGTAGGVDLTLYNNKWFKYISGSSGAVLFSGGYIASGIVSGVGGSGASFYWYDASTGEVSGATRGFGDSTSEDLNTSGTRLVSMTNFGEDLMYSNIGGPIFYFDVSSKTSSGSVAVGETAVNIRSVSGQEQSPNACIGFFIAEPFGHCVAYGTHDIGDEGNLNPMLVRWSDANNVFSWNPNQVNEAGGRTLRHGSEILYGLSTRGENVLFSDSAIYSMRYVGYPDVYGFETITTNAGLYGRRSAIAVDNAVFFIANKQFYIYDGALKPLSKEVNFIFDEINEDQKDKIVSFVNRRFTEVGWLYPSGDSLEPNKYVTYNYNNNTFSVGSFDMSNLSFSNVTTSSYNRTAWDDARIFNNPLAVYVKQYDPTVSPLLIKSGIMTHEIGTDAQGSAINHFVESGSVSLSDGDRFSFYDRIIPDIEIINEESGGPSAMITFSLIGRDLPSSAPKASESVTADFSSNPAGQAYGPALAGMSVHGRARDVSLRVESNSSGFGWRLGSTRVNIRPSGRK